MSEQPDFNAIFPQLGDDVVVMRSPQSADEFIIGRQGQNGRIQLGSGAASVLSELDGQRSCARVAGDLQAAGVPVPGADFILALATALAQQGLLELHDEAQIPTQPPQELISANPLRHRCVGCGRSCEGHMIGPLDAPFLERLPDIMAELGPLYPDLAALESAVVDVEHESGRVLQRMAFKEGPAGGKSCVFLGEDRLCRIHGHLGSATKPLICRLFPLELVQTEDGLRVGVGRCYEAHRSYDDDSQPEQTPSEITGVDDPSKMNVLIRGLDSTQSAHIVTHPEPGTQGWRNRQLEQGWMSLLEQPWTRWSHLYAFVSETTLARQTPSSVNPMRAAAFLSLLQGRLQACGVAALPEYEPDRDQIAPNGYLEQLFGLLDHLAAHPAPTTSDGLTTSQRGYGFHVLRETFFLRAWHRHPSFQVSAMVGLLGLAVASWRAAEAGEVETPGQVGDVFAHTLTTWMRYFNYEKHVLNLFDGLDDYLAFMGELEASLLA